MRRALRGRGEERAASVDAAVVTFLSGLDGVFTLTGERRTTPGAVLGGKDAFALLPVSFGKSLVKHSRASQLSTGR